MSDNYISVSQLNSYIKNIFDSEVMLQNICVYGEVSSYNISNNIAYFNLKDENGLLSCVLFGAGSFDVPKLGDMVLVTGSMNYYAKGGRLSFNATNIVPYGKGVLYEKFLKLKAELESKGYFDISRKKTIPTDVRRIGVVTSSTGAVIRDIIDVTTRRNDSIDIVLYPVKVQGVGAEFDIAKGIEFFSRYNDVDVIIVARGGGSIEDLEPFNTEIVANAVYNCEKPLVSAVGHETDFTIIDFVADLRAPTPSAAAELVAWEKFTAIEGVNKIILSLSRILDNKLNIAKKELEILVSKCYNGSKASIDRNNLKLLDVIAKLNNVTQLVSCKENKLLGINIRLESNNPRKLSDMGYSKISQNGKVIGRIASLDFKQNIKISMIDGSIDCSVNRG